MDKGVVLEPNYNPDRDGIYSILQKYLDFPVLTKVKDEKGISTYMVKCSCLLMNVCRYIIATLPSDTYPIGSAMRLNDLNWDTLQFRILKGRYENVGAHTYNSKNSYPFDMELNMSERNEKFTSYLCENLKHLKVHLFHQKSNNLYEYPNEGTLSSAIETYSTILSF